MTLDQAASLYMENLETAKHLGERRGLTGRLDSSGVVEQDPTDDAPRNKVWVRLEATMEDPGGVELIAAWNTPPVRVTTLQSNVPVTVAKNKNDEWAVVGAPPDMLDQFYGEGINLADGDPPPPEERKDILKVRNLYDFRPRYDSASGGLYLYIEAGWYNGANYWSGGRLDLTAYQTATATRKAFVVVGFDTVTGALVALGGTDYVLPYTVNDMKSDIPATFADATFADAFPIAAVLLTDSATTFANTDITDIRAAFITAAGGTGGTGDLKSDGTVAMSADFDLADNAILAEELSGTPTAPTALSNRWLLYFRPTGLFIEDDTGTVTGPFIDSGGVVGAANKITRDTFANRPAAGTDGNMFYATDGILPQLDDGAAWQGIINDPLYFCTTPPTASWTGDNAGSATFTSEFDTYSFESDLSGDLNIQYRTAPAAPYTLTVAIMLMPGLVDFGTAGLCFRDGGGKIHAFQVVHDASNTRNPYFQSVKWTSSTVFSAAYSISTYTAALARGILFMRIADDNTNRVLSISADGKSNSWQPLQTVARADFLTATQIGLLVRSGSTTTRSRLRLLSWLTA